MERKRIQIDAAPMEEDETRTDQNVNDVFMNSLVLESILTFLPFSDVKAVSEVNSDFRRVVLGSQRWQKNGVLKVTKCTKELDDYLKHSEERWRGVKIDVQVPPRTLNLLARILDSVEFLALMAITSQRHSYDIKKHDAKLAKVLLSVLSSTPKITHLQMDVRFWRSELKNVLSSPVVVDNLKNLKRLDILELDYDNPGTFRGHHGPAYPAWRQNENDSKDREVRFAKNLHLMSHIPKQLESFKLAKVASSDGKSGQALLKHLLAILTNNRMTLKELSVHLDLWKMERLRDLKMPMLQRLTVTVNSEYGGIDDQKTLAAFLKNHPTLEELDVEGDGEIGKSLFSAIKDSTQLKMLHINTVAFSGISGSVDWSFLGSMEHLRDVCIARPDRLQLLVGVQSFTTGRNLLNCLPKNQLESLRLKGISKMNRETQRQDKWSKGFWNSGGVETGRLLKIDLLEGFTCLRTLSLINCLDSVDDHLMQFIVKEFKLLETLEISHCYKLSDAGIAGTGDTTTSIANLRSLKSLTIRVCPLVTPAGILSSVTFPFLKSLEYTTEASVRESFALKLEEQNPSLESLAVNYSWSWHSADWKPRNNSRLKSVGDPIRDYRDLTHEPGECKYGGLWIF